METENKAPELIQVSENQQPEEIIEKYVENGVTFITGQKHELTKSDKEENFIMGIPKSGKPWKKKSRKFNSSIKVNKGLFKTWEEKQQFKKEQDKLKQVVKEIKEKNEEHIRGEGKRIKEMRKRKEVNDFKSGQFQLIKDSKKINKWSRKNRQTLQKIPYELYDKIVKKSYGY